MKRAIYIGKVPFVVSKPVKAWQIDLARPTATISYGQTGSYENGVFTPDDKEIPSVNGMRELLQVDKW